MENIPVEGSIEGLRELLTTEERQVTIDQVLRYHAADPPLLAVYQANLDLINAPSRFVEQLQTYNYPLKIPIDLPQIQDIFQRMHSTQHNSYKLQFMFPAIFRYTGNLNFGDEEEDATIAAEDLYQFGYGSNNSFILPEPRLIAAGEDFTAVVDNYLQADLLQEAVAAKRYSTKYTLDFITNVTIKVYPLENLLMGCGHLNARQAEHSLPNPRNIYLLLYSPRLHRPFNDQLCFFRALATAEALGPKIDTFYTPNKHLPNVESRVLAMLSQAYPHWSLTPQLFPGVPFQDLPRLETLLDFSINLYRRTAAHNAVAVVYSGAPPRATSTIVHLHLMGQHVGLIRDFNLHAQRFICEACQQILSARRHLQRHQKYHCNVAQELRYSYGAFSNPKSALQLYEEMFNEVLPTTLRFQTAFVVFDFESILLPQASQPSATLTIRQRHIPVSYALAHNIPQCSVTSVFRFASTEEGVENLIGTFVEDLHQLQEEYSTYQKQRYSSLLQRVERAMEEEPANLRYPQLLRKLLKHITILPIIGFNSGGYDLKLIRRYLFPLLQKHHLSVIKQHSRYTALFTDELRFLDLSSYLAPHTSLKEFLKAFTTENKGFFPYNWFDNFAKLHQDCLPTQEEFTDTLKNHQLSNAEYAYCQQVWSAAAMTRFSDYLRYYNMLDCTATVTGIEKMMDFYQTLRIDLFADGISLPGLCSRILFDPLSNQTFFGCIPPPHAEVFRSLRAAVTGGLSCAFTRYHEAGQTILSGGRNPCQAVEGWDCNSLYLWALGQTMPIGHLIVRRGFRQFRPEGKPVKKAILWLEYLSVFRHNGGLIRHQQNYGEVLIGGRFRVDGFFRNAVDGYRTAYDFHGCFFHHCPHCQRPRCPSIRTPDFEAYRAHLIRQHVDEYVILYECQFDAALQHDVGLRTFLQRYKENYACQRQVSQADMLQRIMNNQYFGIAEVDIHVPEALRERFSEFPPLIINATITKEHLSPHMQAHVDQYCHGKFTNRRSLISTLSAERILLITPLLQFYVQHGLVVSQLHNFYQWSSATPFDSFCNTVIENRSRADHDPSQIIIGEMFKLIGNSAYGRTLMQTEKFQSVKYARARRVNAYYRQNLFRDCTPISADCFEITMARKRVNCYQPIQIGFFVYGWAKLRMLAFYYDFLQKYVPRPRFELLLTDTDSLYIAFSDQEWSQRVNSSLYGEFLRERDSWLVPEKTATTYKVLRRQRGLFKLEFMGTGVIALGSKLYIAFDQSESNIKKACKGIQKRNSLRVAEYRRVLSNHRSISGTNCSFLFQDNCMLTIEQTKTALTYLYAKRHVLDDGIHTSPLSIH